MRAVSHFLVTTRWKAPASPQTLSLDQSRAYNLAIRLILNAIEQLNGVRMDPVSQSVASCQQRVVLPEVGIRLEQAVEQLGTIAPRQLNTATRVALRIEGQRGEG
jgi:hypothetical protein